MTITAEYPEPVQMDDPIAVLTGRGTQTIAPGGACTGGGDFDGQVRADGRLVVPTTPAFGVCRFHHSCHERAAMVTPKL